MPHDDMGVRYRALVRDRRRLGDARYGDRHLDRADLAANRVQEAADAVIYLRLTASAWTAQRLPVGQILRQRLQRLARDAVRLGEQCSRLDRPGADTAAAFAAVLHERAEYGERNFGAAYLERENLAEALEEIADCQILVDLDRERHRHLTGAPHAHEAELQEISDRCAALGELVAHLRQQALGHSTTVAALRGQPAARKRLETDRRALARLLDLTRIGLQRARPRLARNPTPVSDAPVAQLPTHNSDSAADGAVRPRNRSAA